MAVPGELDPRSAAPRNPRVVPSRRVALLEVDPDLGAGLTREQLAAARVELTAPVARLPRGSWDGGALAASDNQNVGLLLLDGIIAREVLLADTVSTELLGPGDLLRPWSYGAQPHLLAQTVRWQVLSEARLAVLGRPFARAVAAWPEVNAALIDRTCARAHRLATMQAISHLNSVDRRLLALFWHLAERWGRMTTDGVVVPLKLSHRLLAELVGARRPTVTSALVSLTAAGTLQRRSDATWLLTGDPPGAPSPATTRPVAHRRRLLADRAG